jgi:hypothetical protein
MESTNSCLFLPQDDIDQLGIIRSTLAGSSALLCIIAITLIIALKQWKRFTNRLVLYLLLLAMFYSASTTFQWVASYDVRDEPAANVGCKIVAVLVQYCSWNLLIYTFIITLLLFLTIFCEKELKFRRWEIGSILSSVIAPLAIIWIPFINDLYGLSGVWCWIKTHDENNCTLIVAGVIEQVALWYAPLIILMLSSVILIFLILAKFFYSTKTYEYSPTKSLQLPPKLYKRYLKEYSPLLVYPVGFFILNIISLSSRITSTQNVFPKGFLYLHAVLDPLWGTMVAIISIAYIILTSRKLKNFKWSRFKTSNKNLSSPLIR